jgi:hypothetical protein
MKCPFCDGQPSRIYPEGTEVTLMYCAPYYDEQGAYHHHDRNWRTSAYRCSNGHHWTEKKRAGCPSCEWPSEEPQIKRLDKSEQGTEALEEVER